MPFDAHAVNSIETKYFTIIFDKNGEYTAGEIAKFCDEIYEQVMARYKAFSDNQPDLLDQVLAPGWEDIPLNPGQQNGRDAFKPLVSGFHKIFSGLKITNEDIIESGDKVIVRSTIEGTQAADFAGFPSKGRPLKIMAIDIHQFKDGRVVKTWHVEDWLSGLFQMGALEK